MKKWMLLCASCLALHFGLPQSYGQSGDNYGPRVSPDGTQVLFYSYRSGNPDVFLMDRDGSNQANLTNSPGTWDTEPLWSPDGTTILFRSDRDDPGGNRELYKMDLHSLEVQRLTYNKGFDTATDWVGDKIYYYNLATVSQERRIGSIYVMDADGNNQTLLRSMEHDGGRPNLSPDGTKILFEQHDAEQGELFLFTMNTDGTEAKQLLERPGTDPIWSPDGTKIVFGAQWEGYHAIYVMDADGSNVVQVSDAQDAPAYFHDWAPDSRHVVYDASRHGISDIMQVDLITQEKKNLTKQGDYKWAPTWAKGRLAYQSKQDANHEIYLVEKAGEDPINLTQHPATDQQPAFSPNGRKLAFVSDRDGELDLYVMDIKTRGLTRLTTDQGANMEPSWSPKGNQLAFVSTRDGGRDVYIMKTDGSQVRKVNTAAGVYARPSWSGDGQHLAYFTNMDGNWEVYWTDLEGQNPLNITNHEANDFYGSASPDGKHVVFVSNREGNRERHLYTIRTDGTDLKRLTEPGVAARYNHYPTWTPEGNILFISNRTGTNQVYSIRPDGTNLKQLTMRAVDYTYARQD